MLRFENGFEIRDLHHFASKNVPHTTSQILRVTEIQQFRSNQLMLKIVIFKNFKFAPIRKRFRDSGSASLCEQKCPPHHLSNSQVSEIQQFRSNQLMLKIVIFKNLKFAPIRKRFRDSGSASLCEQKCPPHHLSNSQVSEIQQFRSNQLNVEKCYF